MAWRSIEAPAVNPSAARKMASNAPDLISRFIAIPASRMTVRTGPTATRVVSKAATDGLFTRRLARFCSGSRATPRIAASTSAVRNGRAIRYAAGNRAAMAMPRTSRPTLRLSLQLAGSSGIGFRGVTGVEGVIESEPHLDAINVNCGCPDLTVPHQTAK